MFKKISRMIIIIGSASYTNDALRSYINLFSLMVIISSMGIRIL